MHESVQAQSARSQTCEVSLGLSSAVPRCGPFGVEVELWYQPIGYHWAHNLAPYDSTETRRFNTYFVSSSAATAVVLARASAIR